MTLAESDHKSSRTLPAQCCVDIVTRHESIYKTGRREERGERKEEEVKMSKDERRTEGLTPSSRVGRCDAGIAAPKDRGHLTHG